MDLPTMIQLFHVCQKYRGDSQGLVDVTLHVNKGEFVFLTGPSGAGKSTLLKLIFCAERPSSGQLLVNGRNIVRLRASDVPFLRRHIGVVFQDFKLLNRRTVQDNVGIGLEIVGMPRQEIKRRTYATLKEIGLAHKRLQLPPRLSGGEQQRVAIARALVNEPHILLADEPTGNLDRGKAEETMHLLKDANARGTTVVVATHDQQLINESHCRVIKLEAGRVVAA